jgi:predicted ATPase
MRDLPTGAVTFLFTDIEGSTKLLHELGAEQYEQALIEHRRILRRAFIHHSGVEIDTQGDAFFVAFPRAAEAVAAAADAQSGLGFGPLRVRMGLHTGTARVSTEGYVGSDVHKGARIAAAGHGGQVLLSKETRELVDAELLDLGEHRLKDFGEPIAIYQLGLERFPPLRTISNTNLPRPASSFVGRQREVGQIGSLLDDGTRLLTLTGPGGAGKTRLAIEAATELVPKFKAGVFWVGLASLRDPALVPETIAQTIGARSALADHIGERELLLLLDNLEQVIEAAPELASLVESCPNLKLLVTSRERLRVRGEVDYPVLPLAEAEAVQLFCTRAQRKTDQDVTKLCGALDNLPLAVELAAARAVVLTPREILERLEKRLDLLKGGRDADPRQQTLRATIEWSHDLLSAEEQGLFRRLSVFAGGCTITTAEEVADAEADVLQSLVEKSLVRRTGDRFWMLETIREYAGERLRRSTEAEGLLQRRASYFTGLARQLQPDLRNAHPTAIERIEAEHENMRAVLAWSLESGCVEHALELVWNLKHFWIVRAYSVEGDEWARRTLAATKDLGVTERVWAIAGAADLAGLVGEPDRAIDLKLESIEGFRALAEDDQIAGTFADLVCIAADQGDLNRARLFEREAARAARRANTPRAQAFALFARGYRELRQRSFPEAAETFLDAALAWKAIGSSGDVANSYLMAGECFRRHGVLPEASRYLHKGIALFVDLGLRFAAPEALQETAGLALANGATEEAVFFLGAAARARDETGMQLWDPDDYERNVARARGTLEAHLLESSWSKGLATSPEEAVVNAVGYLGRSHSRAVESHARKRGAP